MKTLFIIITCFVIADFVQAQKQVDYIKYYRYASEGDFYFYTNQFDSAVVYFDKAFSFVNTPHPSQRTRYAQSLWNLNRRSDALEQLMLDKFSISVNINRFPGITIDEEQKVNTVLLDNKKENPMQQFYQDFMDSLMMMDQSVRVGIDLSNKESLQKMLHQDSLNRITFLDFTKKYGAPGGVNVGWDQTIGTFFLHLPKEWLEAHQDFLLQEVRKGNIEPWCLARGIDRMWAEGEKGNITSPNGFYYRDTNEKLEVVFENCVKIGASPYFNFPTHQLREGKYFNYFKENKSRFSCIR